jgi:hypothetical protein
MLVVIWLEGIRAPDDVRYFADLGGRVGGHSVDRGEIPSDLAAVEKVTSLRRAIR